MIYYKIEIKEDGTLEVVDRVEEKKLDGYLYATEKEYKKLNPKFIRDYSRDLEL